MSRAVLLGGLPWLGLLLASFGVLWLLIRSNNARFEWGRLGRLHEDQAGGAQTLSFVLTLPFFIMILLFIVQVSQLMIAQMLVEYAAFAAARSAMVWIPAGLGNVEPVNCISAHDLDPEAKDQVFPITDPTNPGYGPTDGGLTFVVAPAGPKFEKIKSAAIMAVLPICPSRNLGLPVPGGGNLSAGLIEAAYGSIVPGAGQNGAIARRIRNKLAYADQSTTVEVRFFHSNREPPLATYLQPEDLCQFRVNELGWQDTITVKVKHNLALLPGPGRLLARVAKGSGTTVDKVSATIGRKGGVYFYPLAASTTLGNEGEESVIPHDYAY